MRYNTLGRTGLLVSELCLGTMTFGTEEGFFGAVNGVGLEGATALLRQAVEAGINFVDTANVYTNGQSEELLGAAISALGLARSEIVVATKAMGGMGEAPNQSGTGRKHLLDQIDASLARLGLDHVDLYQIHGWDPVTPMEEALRALEDIVRSGRARYVGVSNWAAWQVTKALGLAAGHGWAAPVSVQAYYSIAGRGLERELAPMLASEGLGLMAWSPLAGGLLSGKYRFGAAGIEGEGRRASFDFPPVDLARAGPVVEAMRSMGKARGVSVAQIAIAWLLHRPVVSSVIVGAKCADQLADNIAACAVELTADDLAQLERLSALAPEFPGWMIERQGGYVARHLSPPRCPA